MYNTLSFHRYSRYNTKFINFCRCSVVLKSSTSIFFKNLLNAVALKLFFSDCLTINSYFNFSLTFSKSFRRCFVDGVKTPFSIAVSRLFIFLSVSSICVRNVISSAELLSAVSDACMVSTTEFIISSFRKLFKINLIVLFSIISL